MIWKILWLSKQCALETGTRVWLDNHLPDSWIQLTIAELEIEMWIYIYIYIYRYISTHTWLPRKDLWRTLLSDGLDPMNYMGD